MVRQFENSLNLANLPFNRQRYSKHSSLARRTFCADASPVSINNRVNHRETETFTLLLHAEKRIKNLLEKYDLQGLNYRVHLIKGKAGIVIPELTENKRPDIIVMGTLSRSGVAGFFIGNTAEKIIHNVDCSVLTVKPDGFVTPVKFS